MARKLSVAILCGGRSAEHEVSLQSAKSVIQALDRAKYEPLLIGIGKDGVWRVLREDRFLEYADNPRRIHLDESGPQVSLAPVPREEPLINLSGAERLGPIDVIFPVLHGTHGEDGTVQGLLQLAGIPFVGAGVLGSAVGMDKDVMKRLLRDAGIPIARFLVARQGRAGEADFDTASRELGLPLFIKPANLGSSVGISKAATRGEFDRAVADAFAYDHKILIEECVRGREIECAVLGNEDPVASMPGEVIPRHDFYSYEAKYLDDRGAELRAPADLAPETAARVRHLAVEAFKATCGEGMARVDFFLREDGEALVNELNTIPGFTRISMYPRMWEAGGLPFPALLDRLIQLAIERFERDKRLKTSYDFI